MDVLKVSARSIPNAVAGAIAGAIRENNIVELQSIGAGATNQAIKSVAIARGYLATCGMDLVCTPAFTSIEINNIEKTAIKLIVEAK